MLNDAVVKPTSTDVSSPSPKIPIAASVNTATASPMTACRIGDQTATEYTKNATASGVDPSGPCVVTRTKTAAQAIETAASGTRRRPAIGAATSTASTTSKAPAGWRLPVMSWVAIVSTEKAVKNAAKQTSTRKGGAGLAARSSIRLINVTPSR